MEPDIIDDLERKSQEILQSNKGLNELISRFNEELSRLKQEIADKERFESVIKGEVEKLKKEVEEKRQVMATMIDDMKPLEEEMTKNNSLIEELAGKLEETAKENMQLKEDMQKAEHDSKTYGTGYKQLQKEIEQKDQMLDAMKTRIAEQTAKLEERAREVTEKEKKAQETNQKLKETAERLSTKRDENNILKKKLTEKIGVLKHLDEHNADMEQRIELHKREELKLKNRLAVVESKTYEMNDKNQKIMNELLRSKERIQQLEGELEKETTVSKEKSEEYEKELEEFRKNEEAKKRRIMELHSKKITILNTQLASLKAHLEKQQKVVKTRTTQEKRIVEEFMERLKGLAQTSSEIPDVSSLISMPMTGAESEEEEMVINRPRFYDRITAKNVAFEGYSSPKIDEVLPMIEVALQHGDGAEKIKKSLLNSGYHEEDIDKAFKQLNTI